MARGQRRQPIAPLIPPFSCRRRLFSPWLRTRLIPGCDACIVIHKVDAVYSLLQSSPLACGQRIHLECLGYEPSSLGARVDSRCSTSAVVYKEDPITFGAILTPQRAGKDVDSLTCGGTCCAKLVGLYMNSPGLISPFLCCPSTPGRVLLFH